MGATGAGGSGGGAGAAGSAGCSGRVVGTILGSGIKSSSPSFSSAPASQILIFLNETVSCTSETAARSTACFETALNARSTPICASHSDSRRTARVCEYDASRSMISSRTASRSTFISVRCLTLVSFTLRTNLVNAMLMLFARFFQLRRSCPETKNVSSSEVVANAFSIELCNSNDCALIFWANSVVINPVAIYTI